jgi:hypothetical protein
MRSGDVDGEAVDRDVLTAVPAKSLAVRNLGTLHSPSSMRVYRPHVKRRGTMAAGCGLSQRWLP